MRSHLHQYPPAQLGLHQRFCHPACSVGGRAVHLGVVLSRESSAPVGPPTTVCVHDDFPARHSCITLREITKIYIHTAHKQARSSLHYLFLHFETMKLDLNPIIESCALKATASILMLCDINVNSIRGLRMFSALYLRPSNHKASAGLQVIDGVLVQVAWRHHGFDDLFLQHLLLLLHTHVIIVLHGDHHSVHSFGDHSAIFLGVMNCYLRKGEHYVNVIVAKQYALPLLVLLLWFNETRVCHTRELLLLNLLHK